MAPAHDQPRCREPPPGHARAALSRLPYTRYDDDQTGDRADDYRIDEHFKGAPHPLTRRMVDVGRSVDDGGTSPAGLIAVNASCDADL